MADETRNEAEEPAYTDFIRRAIDEDIKTGRYDGRVHTRFPP